MLSTLSALGLATCYLLPADNRIRHNRLPVIGQFFEQLRFEVVWIGHHLAGGDLFVRCAVVAKLAVSDAIFRTHRRAKDPARHGAVRIHIAHARRWIESRADFIVREVFEGILGLGSIRERPRDRIAREVGAYTLNVVACSLPHARRPLRIARLERLHPEFQPLNVQCVDCECTNATLGAAGTAHQPLSASFCRVSESGVHDLDQFLVAIRHNPYQFKSQRWSKREA